jgi:hypothetical protein
MNKLLAKMLGAHDQNSGAVFGALLFLAMFLVPMAPGRSSKPTRS